MSLKYDAALTIGKGIYHGMRMLKRKASYLPGSVALKICPDFLSNVSRPETVILVTGTDGKTTTTNLITSLFEKQGKTVACNRLGSNTIVGLSTALMTCGGYGSKSKADVAVLETDEHWVRIVAPMLKADYLVCTGLLRDSLQRNAHPEYVFYKMGLTDYKDMTVILNADELCSARLLPENRRLYYGIGKLDSDHDAPPNRVNDFPVCPECGHELTYDYVRYGNVGHASCSHCGFESPASDVFVKSVDYENKSLTISYKGSDYEMPMINDGLFNIYNEAAALLLLLDMGVSMEEAKKLMAQSEITKTRYSNKVINGVELVHTMAKGNNSLPVSMVFEYIRNKPGRKSIVMALDDDDEKDSSERIGWIYDTDYEFLNDEKIEQIMVVGPRCYDQYMRLLMAGIDRSKLVCGVDEFETLDSLKTDVDTVYLLHDMSTYDLSVKAEEKITEILEVRA